jgi:hypothetical protein
MQKHRSAGSTLHRVTSQLTNLGGYVFVVV